MPSREKNMTRTIIAFILAGCLAAVAQGCGSNSEDVGAVDQRVSSDGACTKDDECSSGKKCLKPECSFDSPCKGTCIYEAGRCGSDANCNGGECLLPQCQLGGPCPAGYCKSKVGDGGTSGDGCTKDAECSSGKRCVKPECSFDSPCNGICV